MLKQIFYHCCAHKYVCIYNWIPRLSHTICVEWALFSSSCSQHENNSSHTISIEYYAFIKENRSHSYIMKFHSITGTYYTRVLPYFRNRCVDIRNVDIESMKSTLGTYFERTSSFIIVRERLRRKMLHGFFS